MNNKRIWLSLAHRGAGATVYTGGVRHQLGGAPGSQRGRV